MRLHALSLTLLTATIATAQVHPAVPAFSSNPGAAYTMYLDFGGFTFNGNWGSGYNAGIGYGTPGVTPAYDSNGNAAAFNATENANMKVIWSRIAQMYAPFNVNVTTVDPATGANAVDDTARQNYYDSQTRISHTVIGGSGSWSGGGGVSFLDVASTAQAGSNGGHTNWVFSGLSPTNTQFVAVATAHEDGHALNAYHQSDYTGNTLINEYSSGTGTGTGSAAPIMGTAYSSQRALWKIGTAHVNEFGPTIQNDVHNIVNNTGMNGYRDDGIGLTLGTATPLPLINGATINAAAAVGIIVPLSTTDPTTSGSANFTRGIWSFTAQSASINVTLRSGVSTITMPGTADPGAMLNATLELLDFNGMVLATSSSGILVENISTSVTKGSLYYLRVSSAGDPANASFFDIGQYFFTGAVPEPSLMIGVMSFIVIGVMSNRRRKS